VHRAQIGVERCKRAGLMGLGVKGPQGGAFFFSYNRLSLCPPDLRLPVPLIQLGERRNWKRNFNRYPREETSVGKVFDISAYQRAALIR